MPELRVRFAKKALKYKSTAYEFREFIKIYGEKQKLIYNT